MIKKINFLGPYIRGRFAQVVRRSVAPKFNWKKYYDKEILNIPEGTEHLIRLIKREQPFMAGRFGSSECRAVVRKLEIDAGLRSDFGDRLDVMCFNAGFFPHDEDQLHIYGEQMKKDYGEADLIGIMNSLGEDLVIQKYCKNAQLTRLQVFDPVGWSHALKGKKVLVIHPMAATIKTQYHNHRASIYKGTDILPEFDLQTIKAVQTAAGEVDPRYDTWFNALDDMIAQIKTKEFDIALVGAGAYGFPLAAHIKRMNKQAIHVGGCLQLLFGIKGARWENNELYKSFYNEAWVRPASNETPENHTSIEGGCYW